MKKFCLLFVVMLTVLSCKAQPKGVFDSLFQAIVDDSYLRLPANGSDDSFTYEKTVSTGWRYHSFVAVSKKDGTRYVSITMEDWRRYKILPSGAIISLNKPLVPYENKEYEKQHLAGLIATYIFK